MKIPLTTKILIGLFLGIIAGLIGGVGSVPFFKAWILPIGTIFINLIKMIIVPVVLASLVCGMASLGDVKKLGRIGVKTIGYYLSTKVVAITIGILFAFMIMPGTGISIPVDAKVSIKEPPPLSQVIINMVPANPFDAMVKADMLPIIVFALFLGVAITLTGEKAKPLTSFFESLAEVSYTVINIIMSFAPYGVFALIAPVAAEKGPAVLLPLAALIFAVFIACLTHMAIVYCTVVKFSGISPMRFFKTVSPAMLLAFSTCSSSATLPVNMKCTQELGVSKDVSSFVLPLGATVNMDGTAIYVGIASLFIAQVYGIELTMVQLLTLILTATLASIGAAGVPGAGLIMLTLALQALSLPVEGLALVAGVDRVLDMFRTTLNVTGDAVGAVFVDSTEQQKHVSNPSIPG